MHRLDRPPPPGRSGAADALLTRPRITAGRALALGLSAALAWLAACERGARPPGGETAPLDTLRRILQLRDERRYDALADWIVPQRSAAVVSTLVAMDEFLAANERLCEVVRDHIGIGVAEHVDQGHFARNLDIFSPHIEFLDTVIEGERARIAFLVDGRLPARQAELVRSGKRWCYDPGPGYSEQLPAAFRRMARGLDTLVQDMRTGRLPPAELRENPQRLMDEVRLRLLPGVKMLPLPPAAPGRRG